MRSLTVNRHHSRLNCLQHYWNVLRSASRLNLGLLIFKGQSPVRTINDTHFFVFFLMKHHVEHSVSIIHEHVLPRLECALHCKWRLRKDELAIARQRYPSF